jgi:hypothetical protein
MTDQDLNNHNPTPATEPLALRLSEGLAGCFRSGKIVARTPCVTGNDGAY